MNSEKLKPFLIPILLLVATLGGAIYLGSQISTNVQSYMAVKEEVAQKQATVEEKTQKLEEFLYNNERKSIPLSYINDNVINKISLLKKFGYDYDDINKVNIEEAFVMYL